MMAKAAEVGCFVCDQNIIGDVRRTLQESCESSNLLPNFHTDDHIEKNGCNSSTIAKLALAKQEYVKLKPDLQTLQTKLQILEYLVNVNKENWPSSKDEEYKKVHQKQKEINSELMDVEDEIIELVDRAQEEQNSLEEKILKMEQKLLSIETKKQKYAELSNAYTQCLATCKLKNNSEKICEALKIQEESLKLVEASVQKSSSKVVILRNSISQCYTKVQQMKDTVNTAGQLLQDIVDEKQELSDKIIQNTKWCEKYSSLVNSLFQINEKSFNANSWNVDVTSGDNDKLSVVFDKECHRSQHFVRAKIIGNNTRLVEIKDNEALRMNDGSALIQAIRKQFTSTFPVDKEIGLLRERFAIDFLQADGVLVCMLGNCGQIVCRLKIEDGYPATGRISLLKITGQPQDRIQPDLHPPMPNPSLTDWLDHLHQTLG